MSTLYAMVRESGVFFCEKALDEFRQASIRDVPVIQDIEIIATEGHHIAHDGKWILIHTVESLTAALKPRATIGSVAKEAVITRIQDYLRQQSDDVSEVTLSNTSSHCDAIGGRIAKQVVSTMAARDYLNEHLVQTGWEVDKAGKDFITLKRKAIVVEVVEEDKDEVYNEDTNKGGGERAKLAVDQVFEQESVAEDTEETKKRGFLGFTLPR
ncbi:hypothetical protein GNP92_05025 [Paenibacillus timonensis]|nr:hypothetical protein [Paenibacillus timonensis]MUG85714.1 hypothetical protein [Paenibacillus timonensis]